jgi:hypothetical protein
MVLCGVILCRFFRMMNSMQMVSMCDVGMVSRRFLATACLVLSRFSVMSRGMFMMLGGLFVMFCAFFTHREGIKDFRFDVIW